MKKEGHCEAREIPDWKVPGLMHHTIVGGDVNYR
jgi:hypothetical protein